MSPVTIGFTPRDHFSIAAECLQKIYAATDIPFNLVVVDCNIPSHYREQMDTVLADHANVRILKTDQYLWPNQSRNLVLSATEDEYVCLIENDNLVSKGWLETLIQASLRHDADVVMPLLLEGRPGSGHVHFPEQMGGIEEVENDGVRQFRITPRRTLPQADRNTPSHVIQLLETHCLLCRRSVFDRVGPFDEEITYQDEVDFSFALYQAGATVVLEPACEVNYVPPFPPREDELEFYMHRWNLERAVHSLDRIQEKWRLIEPSGKIDFARDRIFIGQAFSQIRQDLTTLIPEGAPFILVDEDTWQGSDIVADLHTIPFLEKGGLYWGRPRDSHEAIAELERLRKAGARYIVFGWTTFWWLEHYVEFTSYLNTRFPVVLDSERLRIFDLR